MMFAKARAWLLILLMASLCAQDLDTALTRKRRKVTTILDQVENPSERKAFERLVGTTDPLARRSQATEFIRLFPSSWLLAQVFEAAAKSSMDLGDFPTALYYARESLRLYPENPLLLVPVAIVQAKRGQLPEAADNAKAALEYLDRFAPPEGLPKREWEKTASGLRESGVKLLEAAGRELPAERTAKSAREPRPAYAGSASCKPCHTEQHKAWEQTGMARMFRPIDPERVIGDFSSAAASSSARMSRSGPNFFIDLRRESGTWDRYRVDYTIGSKWQQAYAARLGGDIHVLPLQYNRLEKAWINYWATIDPPGSERADSSHFYLGREVTSYQQNCAPCHTSQVRETGFAEAGVNCEMCHGPGAAHAASKTAVWSFREASNVAYVRVCAQCHAQSAIREPQPFPPDYQRRPYVEFSRKAFYRDGRFRETTFIVEAFERSACFRKGQSHCGNCHDVHSADAAANPKSLKYRDDPNRMCLQCHDARLADGKHTKHAAASEAGQCVACHMPKVMNSLLFQARTHQIDDRPNAANTARFGQQESPNACLLCHQDRSLQWLTAQLRSW